MKHAQLVPELVCSDFAASLAFYTEVLGFTVVYSRPEDRFVYLDREGAKVMLEQPAGRAFVNGPPAAPVRPRRQLRDRVLGCGGALCPGEGGRRDGVP